MKSHELARKLLELPDMEVAIGVDAGGDSVTADLGDCTVKNSTHITEENGEEVVTPAITIRGWASDTPLRVDWD